ncbi:hypothetical protein GQ53DRAFT_749048 [Thozetella sp. PMI_491]|nr:hypothetical protein GQ53DRAFT_749048 [Thozetella sp. PMI_491]
MRDYSQFHVVFPVDGQKPYDTNGVREIETYRKTFHGVLFIDRVLKALGIGEGKAYPPKGENGLRTLHKHICESKVSPHHKLSVLYYLLLDYDGVRGTRSALAEDIAATSGLPSKYQILMKGLWHMDHQQFNFALEYLAHPSLPSEFADEIVVTLVRHAEGNDFSLPLAYYHATKPVFKTADALDVLYGALAQTSIPEALYFSRAFPEHSRRQLFEKLLTSALDDRGPRGKELVSLPFDAAEEKWFQEYLTTGDGRKSRNAATALELRGIVTGRASTKGPGEPPARTQSLRGSRAAR